MFTFYWISHRLFYHFTCVSIVDWLLTRILMRSSLVFPLNLLSTSKGSFSSAGVSGSEIEKRKKMRNDLFYKSMGVWRALPSSSSSSRSMSSSLSESDSMSCSTFVLVCTEGGGLLSSLNSSLILVLETGDEFDIGGDSFGRSLISSRPKHRRFSGNFAYLTQKSNARPWLLLLHS